MCCGVRVSKELERAKGFWSRDSRVRTLESWAAHFYLQPKQTCLFLGIHNDNKESAAKCSLLSIAAIRP